MAIRIVSDGTLAGTRVYNEQGKLITGVSKITIVVDANNNRPPHVVLEIEQQEEINFFIPEQNIELIKR